VTFADPFPILLCDGPHAGNRVELCGYADDVDMAVAKLRAAGTTVLFAPADQPWGRAGGVRHRSGGHCVAHRRPAARGVASAV